MISLNGILDLQSDEDRMTYFTQKVARQDSIDLAFLERHSPLHVVKKQQGSGVPFLVMAGDRDMMVDTSIATRFKVALDDHQGKKKKREKGKQRMIISFIVLFHL